MTDHPAHPETGDDKDTAYDRESATGIPRWVKVVGIILAVVILLVFAVLLIGGRDGHGPSRHALSIDAGGQAPHSSVTGGYGAGGVLLPIGHDPARAAP